MLKIKYEIKETLPNLFSVKVDDDYDRAMLFMRIQEYYESSFSKIRGKKFNVFDFMSIYRKWKGTEIFTYPMDWVGFNVPGEIATKCINEIILESPESTTPYDLEMLKIIQKIESKVGNNEKWYILGVDNFESETMDHELCHGLYYVNKKYKKSVVQLISSIPDKTKSELEKVLLNMGYCKKVIPDEIQAFMSTGLTSEMEKIKGISKCTNPFKKNFKFWFNQLHQ